MIDELLLTYRLLNTVYDNLITTSEINKLEKIPLVDVTYKYKRQNMFYPLFFSQKIDPEFLLANDITRVSNILINKF